MIHRDGTFAFGDERYAVICGGPGWGYEIVTAGDLRHVADGFFTLAEIRDFVDLARQQGRRTLLDVSGSGTPGEQHR